MRVCAFKMLNVINYRYTTVVSSSVLSWSKIPHQSIPLCPPHHPPLLLPSASPQGMFLLLHGLGRACRVLQQIDQNVVGQLVLDTGFHHFILPLPLDLHHVHFAAQHRVHSFRARQHFVQRRAQRVVGV